MATRSRKKKSGGGSSPGETRGEFRSSPNIQTGLIQRGTGIKAVQYAIVDGLAMFEGDIVLGTAEEVASKTEDFRAIASGAVAAGVAISSPGGGQFRWKNCTIPFTIDPALPNKNRVTDAIAHWKAKTNYKFVERTAANAAQFPDFVTYRSGGGCSSQVGRQGGQQFVTLGDGCSTGNAIHETGHVVGLWHEQSREDRDHFVTIHFDKILAGFEHNFDQHISDGDDIGAYDYGSIMHYPRDAFSKDGSDTITPTNPANAQIGQRVALSAGDIAAANSLCTPLVTKKEVPFDTKKEVVKDIIFDTKKEQILDTFKETVKDTIKEGALDKQFDPLGPDPGRVILPATRGSALPFAVATPHQAPGAAEALAGLAGSGMSAGDAAVQIDQQLQQLAEAIAQLDAQRTALQQQYDELSAALGQAIQQHDAEQG